MDDAGLTRLGRELFIAALGLPLDEIEPWAVDRMTSLLEERSFAAGEVLYRAGDAADFFYFMQNGHVRVTRPSGGPSWIMRGRWAIGALEAVLDVPRTTTVTALADFQAMRVPTVPWIELLEDSFQIARGAVINAARTTALLEERIPELPRRSPVGMGHLPTTETLLPLIERLAMLVDVRMFGGAGVQSLVDLAAATRESSHAVGEVILARDQPRADMLLVVDGEVLATRQGPDIVRHYGPGDIVLGAASFSPSGRAWEARALVPVRLLSFPVEFWFDLMAEHFDLLRATLGALAARRDVLLEHLAAGHDELVLE